MTTDRRYWVVGELADHASMEDFGDGIEFHNEIEEAVRDYDKRRANGEDTTRIFVMRPIADADLYDWGVSSDTLPEVSEYTSERAARSMAPGLSGGRVHRRRIGTDKWEEVASHG